MLTIIRFCLENILDLAPESVGGIELKVQRFSKSQLILKLDLSRACLSDKHNSLNLSPMYLLIWHF